MHKFVQDQEEYFSHFCAIHNAQWTARFLLQDTTCSEQRQTPSSRPNDPNASQGSAARLTSSVAPNASLFRGGGDEWKTLPVQSRQFCSIKVAFTSPNSEQFGASSQRKACEMKDEPPKRHIVATAVLSGAANVGSLTKRGARKKRRFRRVWIQRFIYFFKSLLRGSW